MRYVDPSRCAVCGPRIKALAALIRRAAQMGAACYGAPWKQNPAAAAGSQEPRWLVSSGRQRRSDVAGMHDPIEYEDAVLGPGFTTRMDILVHQDKEARAMGAGQECPRCHHWGGVFLGDPKGEHWCLACQLMMDAEKLIAESEPAP